VGLASSYSQKTILGVEIKRGELAKAAAVTGLEFKVADSTANKISFHDMPEFYRSVDAVLVPSVTEGAQLPIREAAAVGRLVISTPVGDFPLRASQGIGIVAPIEAHKNKKFVAETLPYYRDNPADFTEICRKTQDAAKRLDWANMIGDWVELIDTAKQRTAQVAQAGPTATIDHQTEQSAVDLPQGIVVQSTIGGQDIRFFVTNPNDAIMSFHSRGSFYEVEELELIKRYYTEPGCLWISALTSAIMLSTFPDLRNVLK
jgi:hypothetical protein